MAELWAAFWLSFGVIFVAELGDKSQLMALAFATRYRAWPVIAAITVATTVVHLGSVAIGACAATLLCTATASSAAGVARSDAAYRFPAELQPALKAGFEMGAGDDPEVVTLPNDAGYALVDVENVVEAAPAPLAQIRDRVREDWINRKASDRAKAAATERTLPTSGMSPPASPMWYPLPSIRS